MHRPTPPRTETAAEMDDPAQSDDVTELRAALAGLQAQVAALGARLATMTAAEEVSPPPAGPQHGISPVTRRGLVGAAMGLAAAGAVGLVASATPAAANGQGQSLTLGDPSNTATNATGVAATFTDRAVFQAINNDTGSTATALYARLGSSAGLTGVGAVWADSADSAGVVGTSSGGTGIAGKALGGTGVDGSAGTGTGVSGYATDGVGVRAYSKHGAVALTATAFSASGLSGSGTIVGDSQSVPGVVGLSGSDSGVVAATGAGALAPALDATTYGVGNAAVFRTAFAPSTSATVSVLANDNGPGLQARTTTVSGRSGIGALIGDSNGLTGVVGKSNVSSGVYGVTVGTSGFTGKAGVVGESSSAYGTCGFSSTTAGVRAASSKAEGIRASSISGVGGSFSGGRAALNLVPTATTGRPTTGGHSAGDLVVDKNGSLFLCTGSGTPGTWVRVTVTSA